MLNEKQQQVQQVNLTIEQAKNNIERKKTLYRLLDNKDFKEIIDVGYFRDEAARLVQARADANMQGKEETRHVDRLIDGVGALRQYLAQIERWGLSAEGALAEHEQERAKMLQEQMEETEGEA